MYFNYLLVLYSVLSLVLSFTFIKLYRRSGKKSFVVAIIIIIVSTPFILMEFSERSYRGYISQDSVFFECSSTFTTAYLGDSGFSTYTMIFVRGVHSYDEKKEKLSKIDFAVNSVTINGRRYNIVTYILPEGYGIPVEEKNVFTIDEETFSETIITAHPSLEEAIFGLFPVILFAGLAYILDSVKK